MRKIRSIIHVRTTHFRLVVSVLIGIAALGLSGQTVWADPSCTPSTNGPTGPGATTFTYQCAGTHAGDWTNAYYAYNPSTKTQTALYSPDYSYDCATGTWTKTDWSYDITSGNYTKNRITATAPPDLPTNCTAAKNNSNIDAASGDVKTNSSTPAATASTPAPTPTPTPTPAPASSTPTSTPASSTAASATAAGAPPSSSIHCPQPVAVLDTSAPAPASDTSSGTILSNSLCSESRSGNATVANNGTAGNATSGNATTELDVTNLVQTVSNALNAGATTFTTNVNGNVNGDLVLDPSTILASAASPNPSSSQSATTASETANNSVINNDINTSATSGNATVANNGTAGNATSGNADTIVNLINMINSAVAAGKSFVGTVNINGNLNGNILIPQTAIDQLLASNWNTQSGNNGYVNGTLASASSNTNEAITNNINAIATTGNATVANNDTGGNATSGAANTNVTILNMTGSSIVGKNVLLVFVNVLGKWVGMILNAPTGATSAEFGGNITSSTVTPSSSVIAPDNPISANNNGVIEASANLSITNNVNASAQSGNALVAYNNTAGSATSGNADTAVNILNVENSYLSLANWFGIIFINVFGTWSGNFGILPTPVPAAPSGTGNSTTAPRPPTTTALHHGQFIAFVMHNSTPNPTSSHLASRENRGDSGNNNSNNVLGVATIIPAATTRKIMASETTLPTPDDRQHASYVLPLVGAGIASLLLLASEHDRIYRHRRKK